ncbi:MAG: vancomycin high temperature exclusion protein [Hymenobacter sp.]|nr:MAG: vancomycin high temperature exclusion protein [Hymenobacter sp.]
MRIPLRLRYVIIALVLLTVLIIVVCDKIVENAAIGKIFSVTSEIRFNKVGLVLGTSKRLAGGSINPYYQYRVNAAVDLWKSGKVQSLVISGDNGTVEYNEPADFRDDLIRLGVDSNRIYLDFAGFRTFDSMVRLKKVFGQDSVTIISQQFHNERALYIAKREGIVALAFNAQDISKRHGLKVQAREKLARVKLFVDYMFGARPKYLGERIEIR